jgi:hypothetical protein
MSSFPTDGTVKIIHSLLCALINGKFIHMSTEHEDYIMSTNGCSIILFEAFTNIPAL